MSLTTVKKSPSFYESVQLNFDKAADLTEIPKGLLSQIKVSNSIEESI